MKNKSTIGSLIFFLTFSSIGVSQAVVINEIQASNKKTTYDGFGEFDDWIELYNSTDSTIDLSGMFLSDNLSNPTKHQIEVKKSSWTKISPKSYLIIWMDNDPEQGSRHATFSLKKEKGRIAIFDRDTNLIDQITYGYQKRDYSLGREAVNSQKLAVFKNPSPGEKNKDGLLLTPNSIQVLADHNSGFYKDSIKVTLTSSWPGLIYYTIDGSEPNTTSFLYTQPIRIDSTIVLRSRLYRAGYYPNFISTNSYFINYEPSIPIVSLTTDPTNLWHKRRGIYVNYESRKWEKPAVIEYFDYTKKNDIELAVAKTVDIRIAGKTSRRQPKKSFVISSNNKDGVKRINYKFFDDKAIDSFKSIWVRADATSGRNVPEMWVGERFKNELLYEVNKQMNGAVDMQAYKPVELFLNGKYWGLYNLMERKGEDFIANNYNENNVHILTGESVKVVSGKSLEYDRLIAFAYDSDITNDSIYEQICNRMDVDSYIDYWVNETYCGAHDISVNIRFWKPKRDNSKWRWISYDQDSWNQHDDESLDYYLNHGEVVLLERLMKNKTFRNHYINRMCDYLNTGFKAENVIAKVQEITSRIHYQDLKDRERWKDTMLYVKQNQRVDSLVLFAKMRPDFLRQNMISFFDVSGKVETIHVVCDKLEGSVEVNQIVANENWKGDYIGGVPIEIRAAPNSGYKFIKWKNRKMGKDAKATIDPAKINEVVPVFEKINFVQNRY